MWYKHGDPSAHIKWDPWESEDGGPLGAAGQPSLAELVSSGFSELLGSIPSTHLATHNFSISEDLAPSFGHQACVELRHTCMYAKCP